MIVYGVYVVFENFIVILIVKIAMVVMLTD